MISSSSTAPTQSPHKPEGPSFSDFGITDSGELYANNNAFQRSGPIGAVERIAMAKNDKIYMRVDMPGVPKECLYLTLNPDNIVICGGLAPIECEGDHGRFYGVSYGLRSYKLRKPQANISNGVVRMKISKQKSKNATRCSNSPSLDEELKKDELSFYVATTPSETEGPKESYGAKKVKEGLLYVWVDMPGVTRETVSVGVVDGFVVFSGETVNESNHEESGRTYKGRFGPFDVTKIGEIKTDVRNGVLRMLISEIADG